MTDDQRPIAEAKADISLIARKITLYSRTGRASTCLDFHHSNCAVKARRCHVVAQLVTYDAYAAYLFR